MRLTAAVLIACLAPSALAQAPVIRAKPVATPVVRPGAVQAIGPKQDDPRSAGIVVQGGRDTDADCDGSTDERRGAVAIGPKQDDPRSPAGAASRPGDDEDPKAAGGNGAVAIGPKQDDAGSRGIIVQGGLQDDSRGGVRGPGVLAIGPKQDDPRSPAGATARPGNDEDPKARCMPRAR